MEAIMFPLPRTPCPLQKQKGGSYIYVDDVLRDMTNLIGKGHIDMTVSPNQKP
ncbi:hypothetical protein YC2023_034881 [Brassica napus]